MTHKYVTKETLQKLKDQIEGYNNQIAEVKSISSGGADALKRALEIIRDWEMDNRIYKDLYVKSPDRIELSRYYLGKQEACQDVLTLFEDPKQILSRLDREREAVVNEFEKYKNYEQR